MKEHVYESKRMAAAGWLATALLLTAMVGTHAKPITRSIVLKEQLNQVYGQELLSYPFTAKNGTCVAGGVRLTGPHGRVAVQLADVDYWPGKQKSVKSARLLFVADELHALTSAVYTVTYDKKPVPEFDTGLQITQSHNSVEIANFAQVGIRLPLGGESYATPVSGKEVPGPLAAMRLGYRNWAGESSLTGDSKVTAWSSTLIDAGPVLARVRMTYTFSDGNILTLTAAVTAGDNAVRWTMAVAQDRPALGIEFRLPSIPGVKQVVYPRGYGLWAKDRTQTLTPSTTPFSALAPNASTPNGFTDSSPIIRLTGEAGAELFLASSDPGAWVDPVAPLSYGGYKLWEAKTIPLMWDVWKRKMIAVSYTRDGTVIPAHQPGQRTAEMAGQRRGRRRSATRSIA